MTDAPQHRLGELMEQSNPPFEKVMSCVFGIETHETRAYLALCDQPGSTIEELAATLDPAVGPGTALVYKGRSPGLEPGAANVNALHDGRLTDMGASNPVHGLEVAVTRIDDAR